MLPVIQPNRLLDVSGQRLVAVCKHSEILGRTLWVAPMDDNPTD
jgi:hypothetical protein